MNCSIFKYQQVARSQIGQSKGWFNSKVSSTFSRAFKTKGVLVKIFASSEIVKVQAETGFKFTLGSTSTKHIRQFPATDKLS